MFRVVIPPRNGPPSPANVPELAVMGDTWRGLCVWGSCVGSGGPGSPVQRQVPLPTAGRALVGKRESCHPHGHRDSVGVGGSELGRRAAGHVAGAHGARGSGRGLRRSARGRSEASPLRPQPV